MHNTITVQSGDTLTKIIRQNYNLTNNTDIMNLANLIKSQNNLKNINTINIGQELVLPEQLRLNNICIFNEETNETEKMQSNEKNYYRANDIFGDIATKKQDYPNQAFIPSQLNEKTKATTVIENIVANVRGFFTGKTPRDAKMADIFAKQIGTWQNNSKTVSGGFALEKTDAYKFALSQNTDDYTIKENEYKGKKEEHAYFDNTKSDNKITLFSTELINNKEYLTMRDSENNIHYFDKSNNLTEVEL